MPFAYEEPTIVVPGGLNDVPSAARPNNRGFAYQVSNGQTLSEMAADLNIDPSEDKRIAEMINKAENLTPSQVLATNYELRKSLLHNPAWYQRLMDWFITGVDEAGSQFEAGAEEQDLSYDAQRRILQVQIGENSAENQRELRRIYGEIDKLPEIKDPSWIEMAARS